MKKIIKSIILIAASLLSLLLILNFVVVLSTMGKIKSEPTKKADCILVLGAGIKPDGTPSKMLKDRLDKSIELYKSKTAPKLLVSGDNGTVDYNEVKVMADYIKGKGVPKEDVFLDHAGFSTYETIYRAGDVFNVKTCVIVTQKYHEYRALYIAQRLGVKAEGVFAVDNRYSGQLMREIREIAARDKDCIQCIIKPKPKFLGEKIDIRGNGKDTW